MIGLKGKKEIRVDEKNTAKALGSGGLAVFGTPAMIALMELTARESVQPYLEEGMDTVGTSVRVRHVAATPVGMTVSCESELVAVDGRKLSFRVRAFDASGVIGEGEHERFIVDHVRFQAKADSKREL